MLRDCWREPMKTNQHSSLASLKLSSMVWSRRPLIPPPPHPPQVLCIKVLLPKVAGMGGGKCWGDGAYENLKSMELHLWERLWDPGHFPFSFSLLRLTEWKVRSFCHVLVLVPWNTVSPKTQSNPKPSWSWLGTSKLGAKINLFSL